MGSLGVAVVGAGFASRLHLPHWRRMRGVKLVAIVDIMEERARTMAEAFNADNWFTDYTKVLELDEVDIIDVCTPTYNHKTIVIDGAKAGKHIICEKPIALRLRDADAMIEVTKRQGVKFMVAHCLRFWPEYVRARELVLRGEVGEPRVARAYRRSTFPKWAPWHKDMNLGGGVFVDMSIHDVDFLRWTLGEVEEVYARGGVLKHRDSNAYDYVHAILRFKGGAVAYVEGSWIMPETHPFSTYLEIAGTGGLLRVDNHETSALRVFRTEGTPEDYTPIVRDAYYLELRAFVDCVLKDGEPPVPGEEARRSLEVVLAAVKSIREGRPIRLPLRGEVL